MEKVFKYIVFTFAALGILAAGWLFGSQWPVFSRLRPVSDKADTLYIRDTITRVRPSFSRTETTMAGTVRASVDRAALSRLVDALPEGTNDGDTVAFELPREVVVYEDSLYRAEVSGYAPVLERIDIYAPTRIVTRTLTETEYVRRKGWGVGLFAGPAVGYHYTPQGWQPGAGLSLGIGVTYTF